MSRAMVRLFLAAVLGASLAFADPPGNVPKGWVLHTMKEEGFQVALPRQSTGQSSVVQTPAGEARITQWIVSRGHDALGVAVTRFAPGFLSRGAVSAERRLEGGRDEIARNSHAVVQSDTALRVQGPPDGPSSYPAQEFELLLPDGTRSTILMILAGERLIQINYQSKGTSNQSFHDMVASLEFL